MERLAEARVVQLKPLSLPRRSQTEPRPRQSACAALFAAHGQRCNIEKRLEKLARRTGRTKTYYVREAILEHLEEIEDLKQ
jgi:TraY domain